MKLIKLIKSIPFLFTLILIIFFSLNNQKEYTKLKILIWNTPVLTLGTYIAISSGTGFLISYLMTSSIYNFNESKLKKVINYKLDNQQKEYEEQINSSKTIDYENTLIERDINDPSPTINASFRVIGKRNKNNEFKEYKNQPNFESTDFSRESEDYQYNKITDYDGSNENKTYLNDWLDYSYFEW